MEPTGFSHIALAVRNVDESVAFYAKYAGMQVVHEPSDPGRVVWISDLTRAFVIVLAEGPEQSTPMGRFAHFGIEYDTAEAIDQLCDLASADGCLVDGPRKSGSLYWAFLQDPDGHHVEISHGGRSVTAAVDAARNARQ